MDALTYKLEQFEGPLDLLLTLIQKNKVSITDIPISLICDQYLEYIKEAEALDMDIASEFIVMASELMLIKSKMLLPKEDEESEDPRATLADALLRYQQAKEAAKKLSPLYAYYSGRMVKDTDEISVDKTYVADTDASRLYDAMRRMLTYARGIEDVADKLVRPIVARPIIPVHLKILGIMRHFETDDATPSLGELLDDADSRPDLVAIFIGVLELVRMRRLILIEKEDEFENLHGVDSRFAINPDYSGNLVDDFDSSGYDA